MSSTGRTNIAAEARKVERSRRFRAREFLHEYSSLPRLRRCSYRPIDRTRGVDVVVGDGVAHYAGVQLCGSIHACPVCAPKIREQRAEEINHAAVAHLAQGGGLAFLTLTLPHGIGDDLVHLLDTISDGWRRIWQGRAGQARRLEYSIEGYVRSLDFTHGANGWHPHLHVLLFLETPAQAQLLELLRYELHTVWSTWSLAHGYRAPSHSHGVRLDPVTTRAELGGYLAKVDSNPWHVGRELARADRKNGRTSRTPWEILQDAHANGDASDLELWKVYEQATLRRRAITWSRGLKARYAVPEVDDQELADAEVGGEPVARIPTDVWARLRRRRGLVVQVLEHAELGGLAAVVELVTAHLGESVAVGISRPPDVKEPPPDEVGVPGAA